MNIDDFINKYNNKEIKSFEAEIKDRETEIVPSYQHYGPVENLSDEKIKSFEAEIKDRKTKIVPLYQHYGPVENLSDEDIRIKEAQRTEQKEKDIPYIEYFEKLIINTYISDNHKFEEAVIYSMQSNEVMQRFSSNMIIEISKLAYEFKNIDKTDVVNIENKKQKLENLVNIYVKYLYELKKHNWDFHSAASEASIRMIDSDTLEDLWQLQKQFNITFNMPIPKDLGEDYGHAFDRKGKMIPGISLMYDDLKGKEVDWHKVLIYRENELTPYQKYKERQAEQAKQAIEQFNSIRREEQENILNSIHEKREEQSNITSFGR